MPPRSRSGPEGCASKVPGRRARPGPPRPAAQDGATRDRATGSLRILHFSDLHGRRVQEAEDLIRRHRPHWIVLTGDILPDFLDLRGPKNRLAAQRDWWRRHQSRFERPGAVTTFSLGNHELEGFRAREHEQVPPPLQGRVGVLAGVPREFGAWGFSREMDDDALREEARGIERSLVVLSHCPPHGWLDADRWGDALGHRVLRDRLEADPQAPLLVLCGHVHASFGQLRRGRTLVVNAATGYALIDLDLAQGVAQVAEMASLETVPVPKGATGGRTSGEVA